MAVPTWRQARRGEAGIGGCKVRRWPSGKTEKPGQAAAGRVDGLGGARNSADFKGKAICYQPSNPVGDTTAGGRAGQKSAVGRMIGTLGRIGPTKPRSTMMCRRRRGSPPTRGPSPALCSASAIYYSKNGETFPTQATLQTLVRGFNGTFQCSGATWAADTTNGQITYTPNNISAC